MKNLLFAIGFLLLLATEILRVYYIMPFPGSQQSDSIGFAYFVQSNLGLIRLAGILLILWPMYETIRNGTRVRKIVIGFLLLIYAFVFFLFNFKFLADKMFLQPRTKIMSAVSSNAVSGRQLIVGVAINGEAKAYPIKLIGYHHQVRDTVGGEPIMVTYCTVCRTGRVYRPTVDGVVDNFRLVGMDHFNAMFEDSRTRSWWRQVNGEAIAGELTGKQLPVVQSEQVRLESWIRKYPNTLIMQPDPSFEEEYAGLVNYDKGKSRNGLTGTDTVSWKRKSWVVGIENGKESKAYDWIEFKKARVINDEVGGTPVVLTLEGDTASFHVWNRIVGHDTLEFAAADSVGRWSDTKTHSYWDGSGVCTGGPMKGKKLDLVQAYQEFWHSWRTFHPETKQYKLTQ